MKNIGLRRNLILTILNLQGSSIPKKLTKIQDLSQKSDNEISHFQHQELYRMLNHAQKHIPYYQEILPDTLFNHSTQTIDMSVFQQIPVLTKDLLNTRNTNLQHPYPAKEWGTYQNTSGGSTGEPSQFMQDKIYSDWNIANKLFYKEYYGNHAIGDLELRLWGSEKDILYGKETLSMRMRNLVYNRIDLNTYKLDYKNIQHYIDVWNTKKPSWVEAYVNSAYQLAKYINQKELITHKPKGVLVSAGKLEHFMQKEIEKAFQCPIYNRYGSREIGDVACSDGQSDELILSPWNHYVEILNNNLQPCEPGEAGKIYVTTLHNFSMPLIRYQVEDIATFSDQSKFGVPKISQINGRVNSMITTNHARLDSTALTTSFYEYKSITKYQFIQKTKTHFILRVVIHDQNMWERDKDDLLNRFKKILGEDITIDFVTEEEILPSKSGKYLYIISEVTE